MLKERYTLLPSKCNLVNPPWLQPGITMNNTVQKLCEQFAYEKPVTFKVIQFAHLKKYNAAYSYSRMKTSYYSYAMSIDIFSGGIKSGKGSHVSVAVHIITGPYDHFLSWPFIGTVKVELLNQRADNNHHHTVLRFTENSNIQSGYGLTLEKFIRLSELYHSADGQFLMDDTLYFRVTMSIGHSKRWLKCSDD